MTPSPSPPLQKGPGTKQDFHQPPAAAWCHGDVDATSLKATLRLGCWGSERRQALATPGGPRKPSMFPEKPAHSRRSAISSIFHPACPQAPRETPAPAQKGPNQCPPRMLPRDNKTLQADSEQDLASSSDPGSCSNDVPTRAVTTCVGNVDAASSQKRSRTMPTLPEPRVTWW